MKKLSKVPKKTLTYDGRDFNVDHNAKLSLEDFLKEHKGAWPRSSKDERVTALTAAHGLIVQEAAKQEESTEEATPATTTTVINSTEDGNDNTAGNAGTVSEPVTGAANGGRGRKRSDDAGQS